MPALRITLASCCALVLCALGAFAANQARELPLNFTDFKPFEVLQTKWNERDQALIKKYCLDCHSTAAKEGDFDLERFRQVDDMRADIEPWQRVQEQLENGEMPPRDAPQPSATERAELLDSVDLLLLAVATENSGDPGPVVLRRLNNAEYTYTIQDLTGVSLQPAREFPADSAAGEGFTNVGSALVMSPALLEKYLAAAKEVASHAVLLPDRIEFSPATTPRDWTNEKLVAIRDFYARYTDNSGATAVNLQGIQFETNGGGRLPLQSYIRATLLERMAISTGKKEIAQVAQENHLNEKYLRRIWSALTDSTPSKLLDPIRQRWHGGLPEDATQITADILRWQCQLWRFTTVGHIGKKDGPQAWQVPVNPLVTEQEVRLKLPPSTAEGTVTIYLVCHALGDGNNQDYCLWDNPRLLSELMPEIKLRDLRAHCTAEADAGNLEKSAVPYGLDPALFGKHPNGAPLGDNQLCMAEDGVLAISIPAKIAEKREFVATVRLHEPTEKSGGMQVSVLAEPPAKPLQLIVPGLSATTDKTVWTDAQQPSNYAAPLLVADKSAAQRAWQAEFDAFRQLFPAALCYTKIVPVDEVVTLTLFYREDDQLQQLLLDNAEIDKLNSLWSDLYYVSRAPLMTVDAYEQLWQFATQDADPSVFTPMKEEIMRRAEEFRGQLAASEPAHLRTALEFAARAWRRPLSNTEQEQLQAFYRHLRELDNNHEDAIRALLTRILVSPAFMYKSEQPPAGASPAQVNDWELASRLSYFLWSSLPDNDLRALAMNGKLRDLDVLAGQVRRMSQDPRIRRLAVEYGCQWLHIRELDAENEKSEQFYPEYAELRSDFKEEAARFFTDFFQANRGIGELLNADYVFVNGRLAKHYGIPGVEGDAWRKIEQARQYGRGGILGFAATLSKHSGASRSSPILRGNWVVEFLLGQRLPPPPRNVPVLPEVAPGELTERELTARHSSDAACAKCHARIDPFGFALEGYDTIGRLRTHDRAGHAVDVNAILPDGTKIAGLPDLRDYLLHRRRADFTRAFNRKLLGYALGRGVQLSDESLLKELDAKLTASDGRITDALIIIVRSPQFTRIRGAAAKKE